MQKILICNDGCDDTTYTEIELSNEELKSLIKIAKANNKNSSYDCQPNIRVYKDYEKKDDFFVTEKNWDVETGEYEWEATDLTKIDD